MVDSGAFPVAQCRLHSPCVLSALQLEVEVVAGAVAEVRRTSLSCTVHSHGQPACCHVAANSQAAGSRQQACGTVLPPHWASTRPSALSFPAPQMGTVAAATSCCPMPRADCMQAVAEAVQEAVQEAGESQLRLSNTNAWRR